MCAAVAGATRPEKLRLTVMDVCKALSTMVANPVAVEAFAGTSLAPFRVAEKQLTPPLALATPDCPRLDDSVAHVIATITLTMRTLREMVRNDINTHPFKVAILNSNIFWSLSDGACGD